MSYFIAMTLAQAIDPIKIIIILLIATYIKKGRVYYIFVVGGLVLGGIGIWLIRETNPAHNVNIITHMLASIMSAHLLYGGLLLFSAMRKYYLKIKNKSLFFKKEINSNNRIDSMNEKQYYPGFVDVDLKSGNYNVVSEQKPGTLTSAVEKIDKFLEEAESRKYTIGEISESPKITFLKKLW